MSQHKLLIAVENPSMTSLPDGLPAFFLNAFIGEILTTFKGSFFLLDLLINLLFLVMSWNLFLMTL